jgi:hypothetical protein
MGWEHRGASMSTTELLQGKSGLAMAAPTTRKSWPWQQYVALVGVVFLVWEFWTYGAWIKAGPQAIDAFRDTSSTAWVVTWVYQAVVVVMATIVLTIVIRRCLRERRLTFDAMLCIAGASAFWLDPVANFFQPVYVQSSDWINVGNWCSQMPFVVNTQCGRVPEPILFMSLLYLTGFVAIGAGMGYLMDRIRRRYPEISKGKLILCLCVLALIVDLIVEYPPMYLHLWNYPGSPNRLSVFSHSQKYPITLAIGAIIGWGSVALLRNMRNDRGQTIVERGLEHVGTAKRTLISLLATIAFMNLMVFAVDASLAVGGPYSSPWTGLPRSVVNAVCDTPDGTVKGTVYGPCPGSPGYKMPGRNLQGPKPPSQ